MKPIDNSQLLAQMRAMAISAGIPPVEPQANIGSGNVQPGGFSNLLVRAIDNVNATQKHSAMLSKSIETGDGGASLVQAMIASQKASISFQAVMQVRNKVASAYKDIMSMPL